MFNTNSLYNKCVYVSETNKKIGHVRTFIFSKDSLLGLVVKRPDIAWMFHRANVFIPIKNVIFDKNSLYVSRDKICNYSQNNLQKKFGKKDSELFFYIGLPIYFSKKSIGNCSAINYNSKNFNIANFELEQSKISNLILGKSRVDFSHINFYKTNNKKIVLNNNPEIIEYKKGLAEKSGEASSYLIHKIKKGTPKVVDSMQNQSEKIHTMFKDFNNEFKKGMNDE